MTDYSFSGTISVFIIIFVCICIGILWCILYNATGETDKGKHGGHKPKLITEEHCAFLRELMEEDCKITLEYMQEQLMRQIDEPIIVMDNVGIHHMDIVLEEMIILGLDHHFLPPYSPFFNPIENMSSQWKHYVRVQKPRNYDELTLAMNNVGNVVTSEDCNNYITKINRNCQACINGQDFFDN